MTMQSDAALATSGLSKEQAEEIFLLTREAKALGRKLARNFIQLSHKKALFCMGVQATGYEKATSGHPDHVTIYYSIIKSEGEGASAKKLDEAINHLREEAGKAWLNTNSIIFHHTLEYQKEMVEFLTVSSRAIEALHDHIWEVVMKVMENAGKPVADGLGIALHLVDMLPTIPLQLAFNTATPWLSSFAPKVYSARPNSITAKGS